MEGRITIDPSHLFYIHPTDHPSMVLVSNPLNGDNYSIWSRFMSIALSARNQTGFFDGSIQKPSQRENSTDYALWKRCNDMILSWILNSLEADLANSVIYTESVFETWKDLRERFSHSNNALIRIFQIKKDIASHTQNQLSVAVYFTKLKGLWDELASYNDNDLPTCTCGAIKPYTYREQGEKVIQFLMGLNDSYSAIRGQILLMNPLPSIGEVYSLILQEGKLRVLATTQPHHESMAVTVDNGHKGGCGKARENTRKSWENGADGPSNNFPSGRQKQEWKPQGSFSKNFEHEPSPCGKDRPSDIGNLQQGQKSPEAVGSSSTQPKLSFASDSTCEKDFDSLSAQSGSKDKYLDVKRIEIVETPGIAGNGKTLHCEMLCKVNSGCKHHDSQLPSKSGICERPSQNNEPQDGQPSLGDLAGDRTQYNSSA